MDCQRYSESLSEAALGAPEPRRKAALAAHLADCTMCRVALDQQRLLVGAIDRGITASVAAEPSPQLMARIRQRLEEEPLLGRPWFRSWIPVAAGAVAALAVLVLWLVRPHPEAHRRDGPVQTVASRQPQLPPAPRPGAGVGEGAALSGGRARSRAFAPVPRGGRQVTTRAREPEVLVPPGQGEAVLRLYEGLRRGRVDRASLLVLHVPGELAELSIAPLEVASLDLPVVSEASKSP